MQMVSYTAVAEELEARREWSGVRDGDDNEGIYGTEEELYEGMLDTLRRELFKDKYTLCLQIRGKSRDEVIYEFPRVVCPELFLEQLRIRRP
jgi:hypothetical protein